MTTANFKYARRAQRNRTRLKKMANGRPRLSVFRSAKNISVQIIDDEKGVTIASASSLEEDFIKAHKKGANKDAAAAIGKLIAERAKQQNITRVVFDRGAYIFHGRVKALADAAREGGLEF
ncbi:MAG: 50S ribosomal protein L18 [Hyphomonadaceae bacterium]